MNELKDNGTLPDGSEGGTETPYGTTRPPSSTPGSESANSHTKTRLSETNMRRRQQRLDYGLLRSIFAHPEPQFATDPSGASSLWYILTTAILLAFHKEKLIGDLWTYLARTCHNEDHADDNGNIAAAEDEKLLVTARRIREACLKASTLVGFPRAINALFSLTSAIQSTHPSLSRTLATDTSLRAQLTPNEKYKRGMSFFSQIYKQHTSRVLAAMDATSGGDLTHFAINCIYGELLSEHRILGGLETGLLEFVCCLADGCGPQAKGHFFGSINLGATNAVLRSAVQLTEVLAQQLRVRCPWKARARNKENTTKDDSYEDEDGVDDFQFLEKVMQSL